DNFDELPLETIQKKVADSRVLVAMAVAYDMGNGSDELLKALTRFPCVPSRCHLGGLSNTPGIDGPEVIARFFGKLGEVAELADEGMITETAYRQLRQVFAQLGTLQKDGKVNFNMAKGASEVISLAIEEARKGHKITGFEVRARI